MGKIRQEYITPKVIVFKDDEDIEKILNLLKAGNEVILNLSNLDLVNSLRVINFISGYVMAFCGKRKKIEDKIYSFKLFK